MESMPSLIDRAMTRAITPRLGNRKDNNLPVASGRKGKIASTRSVQWVTPGQPMQETWDSELGQRYYYSSYIVMRCVRTIAETVGQLPWRAGPDPDAPVTTVANAPLAKLLGPATPAAPGGPNPTISARTLWIWTVAQFVVTGKMAWELQRDRIDTPPFALWPLVSAALHPIPSPPGEPRWFDGFQYLTPSGETRMPPAKLFYAWRPSLADFRQPESDLQAAQIPMEVIIGMEKYMAGLLKAGMTASTLVITPPFAEPEEGRAFEENFLSEYTGVDRAGSTIFAEFEPSADDKGNTSQSVRVEKLAQTSMDAQLLDWYKELEIAVTMALSVPQSLIGNASQRTYANADSEYHTFWTLRMLPLLGEIQDYINTQLAPLFADGNVGWFDLTEVEALQPPGIFQQPAIKDAIDEGVATAAQVAEILRIPATGQKMGMDVDIAPIGQASGGNPLSATGSSGGRELRPGPNMDNITQAMLAEGFRYDGSRDTWELPREAPSMRARRIRRVRREAHHGVVLPDNLKVGRERT